MFRVPTRPLLQSFWIAVSITIGLGLGVLLWALHVRAAAGWALGIAVASAAAGLVVPGMARRPYESWKRLARRARRASRLWLAGVVFVILTVVGWLGGRLTMAGPRAGGSGWTPKRDLESGSYGGDSDLAQRAGARAGWIARFGEWTWRSGHAWAWSLVPLLALLKRVEGESAGSLGGNVYTLY